MGGVSVGALVVNLAADVAQLRTDMSSANKTIEESSKKMSVDLASIKTGLEQALNPLQKLTVNVGSLDSVVKKAESSVMSLGKNLIIGAAAGLSFDALRSKVMSVIDGMANLKTISEKTGSSVENLSKLSFVAKASGSDLDSVATAITRLSKGMAGADDETKGAGAALKYLGLQAKDAAGNLKDPAKLFSEIAVKLDAYSDGAGKAAIAQALFGKAGAEMLPTLKMLAEQGDIAAKVTTAQAEAARQYTRDTAKLEAQKQMLFKTVAVEVLPTMTDFANVLLDASKNTNILNSAAKGLASDHSITEWANDVAVGIARVVDVLKVIPGLVKAVSSSFQVVYADVAALTKMAGVLATTPYKLVTGGSPHEELKKIAEERNKILEDANNKYDDLWNKPANQTEQAMLQKLKDRNAMLHARGVGFDDPRILGGTKKNLNYDTSGEDKVKEKDDYDKLNKAVQARIALANEELRLGRPLTEFEKEMATLIRGRQEGTIKLTNAEFAKLKVSMEGLKVEEQVKAAAKEREIQEKIRIGMIDDAIKALNDQEIRLWAAQDAVAAYGKSIDEANALTQLEISLTGQTTELRSVVIEQYKIEMDLQKRILDIKKQLLTTEDTAALIAEAQAAAARAKAGVIAKVQMEEWNKTVATMDQTFHDGFAAMLNHGQGAWTSFTKALKNTFKTTLVDELYKMFAKPFVLRAIASIGSTFGMTGAAQAAGSMDGFGSILSNAQGLSSIGSAIGNIGSAAGAGTGFLGSLAGGLNGAGVGSGLTSSLGMEIGNSIASVVGPQVGGMLSSVAAAAPYLAAAYAAYTILKSGLSMGDKQMTGQTVTGTFANGGLDAARNVSWHQDGGWLRSDRNGVWNYNLANSTAMADGKAYQDAASVTSDQALQKTLLDAYTAMKAATTDYAKVLGVNADSIASRTDAINFAFGKDASETQTNIAKALGEIGDAMAGSLIPDLNKFALAGETSGTTLQRLAVDYRATDVLALTMGKDVTTAFGAVGLASVTAREKLVNLAGGLVNLQSATGFFSQNFLSSEEQAAPLIKDFNAQMTALGAGTVASSEQFKNLVLSQDLSTDAGQKMYVALLKLAPEYKQILDLQGQMSNSAQILATKLSMTVQLLQATGDAAGALALQRQQMLDGLDPSLKDLQQQVWDAQDKQSIDSKSVDLNIQLMQASGDTVGALALQRKKELEALDPALHALQQQVWATQDKATVDAAAAAATQQAAQAAAAAAQQLTSAWQSVTDSIFAEVSRIRGLVTNSATQSLDSLQSQFAITTAQARAGDQNAAKLLPQLSQTLLTLAESQATSLQQLIGIRAQTANSLESTGGSFSKYGVTISGFATGGDFGGGLRLVGEKGPELEVTGPSRIFNAQQTASMLGGGEKGTKAEITALRAEVANLNAALVAIAQNTDKTAKVLVRNDTGTGILTSTAFPA